MRGRIVLGIALIVLGVCALGARLWLGYGVGALDAIWLGVLLLVVGVLFILWGSLTTHRP
jgi:hypothetical protein